MAWEHESPVSYETGTNHHAWGLPPADEPDAAPPPQPAWLSVAIGSAIQPQPRPAYCHTSYVLADALDSDPAWQRWWRASGIPQVTAHLFFGDPYSGPRPGHPAAHEPDQGAEIRPGRRLVDASFWTTEQPFTTTDQAALRHCAITDLTSMMDRVRQALDLPSLPKLPGLPDLPEDLPDAYPSDFDGIDTIVAAITELAQHHDHVTPQMIDQYINQNAEGEADTPT